MDYTAARPRYVRAHRDDLGEILNDQAQVVLSVYEQLDDPLAVSAVFDRLRWNRELRTRLQLRNKLTASDFGAAVASELGARFDPAELDDFLVVNADVTADTFNAATEQAMQEAMADEDAPTALRYAFGILLGSRLDRLAETTTTRAANFGMVTGATQAGARYKVWNVNSRNPRSAHASMAGARVELGENFSNGMAWPGDPAGGADNNANCRCSVTFEE